MSLDSSVDFSSFPTSSSGHSLTCCIRHWSPQEVKVAVLPDSRKTLLCSLTSLYSHSYAERPAAGAQAWAEQSKAKPAP